MENCNICEFSDELKQTLCILFRTKTYLILFIIAIIISLYTTDIFIKDTIKAGCNPDEPQEPTNIFKYRVTSNILSTSGLFFFYCLSKKTLENNTDKTDCSPFLNYIASGIVLFAAIIRLYEIIYSECRTEDNNVEEDEIEDILSDT